MRDNAAQGPDDLNAAFYKASCKWIGDDIVDLVQKFCKIGNISLELKQTYIALIPKKSNLDSPKDFRPISLCNVI